MTLHELIDMGGFGVYVWSSYGLCFVVLLLNVIQPLLRERKTIKQVKQRLIAMEQSRRDPS